MSSKKNIFSSLSGYLRQNELTHKTIASVLLVIEFVLSVIPYLARIRFLRLTAPGRIGHLALEPDIFVKTRLLGMRGWYFGVLISPPGNAANECMLDYWSRYITVVRSPFWARLIGRFYRFSYLQYDLSRYVLAINETAPYVAVLRDWGGRPPVLTLTEEHQREGREALAAMGIPAGAEYVCFHCREGGYSPSDEDLHSFRNCSIDNYLLAVSELAKRGIWCIRMGDPTMRPIAPMDKVIDYAHHELRSARMDVFLSASCKFFIGSSSGLLFVASAFGKPSAAANQAPLSTALAFAQKDVALPMLLWSEREGRYLNFVQAFASDAANFRFTNLYRESHIRVIENSAEDIRDLTFELLDRTEGRAVYSQEDERLQQRFKALMRPGHYSYGGGARVGRDFLRKYASLLEDASDQI